jgi:hypothetical protein
MGATKWRDEYSKHFKGASVVILPDKEPMQASNGHQGSLLGEPAMATSATSSSTSSGSSRR